MSDYTYPCTERFSTVIIEACTHPGNIYESTWEITEPKGDGNEYWGDECIHARQTSAWSDVLDLMGGHPGPAVDVVILGLIERFDPSGRGPDYVRIVADEDHVTFTAGMWRYEDVD